MSAAGRERDAAAPGGAPWRIGLVAGGLIFAFGLAGLLRNARMTLPGDWLAWVAGALVVHDLLVVPAVLAAGVVLARFLPAGARGAAQATLAVCGAVALMSVPVLLARGRRADNPSLLPHDYAQNLALVLAAILVAGLLVAAAPAVARRLTGRTRRG